MNPRIGYNVNEKEEERKGKVMAGSAEKKRRAANALYNRNMLACMLVVNIIFLYARIYRWWDTVTGYTWAGYLLSVAAAQVSFSIIRKSRNVSLHVDMGTSKYLDLIGVTFLARVGVALHTDRWWYAYLLVVVYIVYKLINLVLAWVRAGDTKQQVAEDDKASLSRKERRAREKQEKKLRKRN
tara:strand:- start:527 stop:1075 length:549 start_codon:yes stop_codon:yes gene_type:complete